MYFKHIKSCPWNPKVVLSLMCFMIAWGFVGIRIVLPARLKLPVPGSDYQDFTIDILLAKSNLQIVQIDAFPFLVVTSLLWGQRSGLPAWQAWGQRFRAGIGDGVEGGQERDAGRRENAPASRGKIENCEAQARVRQGSARDGSQGERPQSVNSWLELTLKLVTFRPL